MTLFLNVAVVLLILLLALALWRVYLGPEQGDRMLAVQILSSTTVGILVLLSARLEQTVLLHVALLFALLAVLVAMAFVRHGNGATGKETE